MKFSKSHVSVVAVAVIVSTFLAPAASDTTAVPVGLILDTGTPVGKIASVSIKLALADFYASHSNFTTRLVLCPKDSAGDVIAAASAAFDLMEEGVHAIIGPPTSAEAAFVANLGAKAAVPIISFSATSSSLSPARSSFFIRTAPSDAAQAAPIAALVKAFGWHRAVPVFEDTDYGTGFIPYLVDALGDVGATVPYRSRISVSASDDRISEELYRLQTFQTRVFVIHMSPLPATRFFSIANEAGMMSDGYVWIATAGLIGLLGSVETSVILDSMQGVLGLKPYIPRSTKFEDFRNRFKGEFMKEMKYFAEVPEPSTYGLWAYDTVWALGLAAEAVGVQHDQWRSQKNGLPLAVSVRSFGRRLLDAVLTTSFDSLGGRFWIDDGERNVSAFQFVNIVGEHAKEIGFWTAKYGITRRLNWTSMSSYSVDRASLGPVIWPGETTAVTKGWQTPTAGRKLRIAVPGPVDPGFQSFLKVVRDQSTNETVASGFVIEVFEAAVKRLPYALQFEYVMYESRSGGNAGAYNDLIKDAVYYKKYDAVVGDTTITANRSMYVDFTLPYTMAGVSMVVPVRDSHSNNAWIFLKPLTLRLWIASLGFFVLTGIVIWAIEDGDNQDFKGSVQNQIGTVFYFTFCTLVFSHKENIRKNCSKMVVIVWVFVVLILQQSYTASLTSMLTVRRFDPVVTNFNTLIDNKEYVGYLKNSFTRGLLIMQGFDPSKLRPYRSPEEYAEALAKGSKNGGVAAIIDEIPYLKLFLQKYCDKYTRVSQTIKTSGFGYVFPKGSPLVADLSRAILSLTESEEMGEIGKKWFSSNSSCTDYQGSVRVTKSYSLDFTCFWGIFVIYGSVSLAAFIIHLAHFFYKNRETLQQARGDGLLMRAWRLYSERDENCPEFQQTDQMNDGSARDRVVNPTVDRAI